MPELHLHVPAAAPMPLATPRGGESRASIADLTEGLVTAGVLPSDLAAAAAALSMVTPEGIVKLVETRLRQMDRQITSLTRALDAKAREAQDQSARLAELREFQRVARAHLTDDRAWVDVRETTVDGRSLNDWAVQLGFEPGTSLTESDIQEAIDTANETLREINSGNEMMMIALQSAMQQRTQIIQLGTNMLKAIDEGGDSIIGNIR